MNFKITTLLVLTIMITSCKGEKTVKKEEISTPTYDNKGQELVSKMVEKVGTYQTLRSKRDVIYTYS